jgi:hypothetical protein
MAKRKLTPEQQKHKEIGDKMQKEGLYICEYCLTEIKKAGTQIVLFVSSKPDMWGLNTKGKMFCTKLECQEKSVQECRGA